MLPTRSLYDVAWSTSSFAICELWCSPSSTNSITEGSSYLVGRGLHVLERHLPKPLHLVQLVLVRVAASCRRRPRSRSRLEPLNDLAVFGVSPAWCCRLALSLPASCRFCSGSGKYFLNVSCTALPTSALPTLTGPSCSPSKTSSILPVMPGSTCGRSEMPRHDDVCRRTEDRRAAPRCSPGFPSRRW